jgi:hypothetical protein
MSWYEDDLGGGPLRGANQNRIAALRRLNGEAPKSSQPDKPKTGKSRRRRRPDRKRGKNSYFSN